MNDSFGNYFIQKILEKVNEAAIYDTLITISPHFLGLGLNPHGTRVLQKLIEALSSETLLELYTKILQPNLLSFIKDVNGNHIIQKLVFTIGAPGNQFIYDTLNSKIVDIATHKHGCCVLQKCIEGASPSQRSDLFNLIIKYTQVFIVDQFGNYVVQYAIMLRDIVINKAIADEFLKMNIITISKQKFSSNVIEKCFDNCSDDTRMNIIKEISHPEVVYHLLFDNYGNYVLQKALAFAREPHYSVLIRSIAPHLERLKFFQPFGSKLFMKLVNTYPEFQNMVETFINSGNEPNNHNNEEMNTYHHNNRYINSTYVNNNNVNTSVNNNNNNINNFGKRSNRRNMNMSENPRNPHRLKHNKFQQ